MHCFNEISLILLQILRALVKNNFYAAVLLDCGLEPSAPLIFNIHHSGGAFIRSISIVYHIIEVTSHPVENSAKLKVAVLGKLLFKSNILHITRYFSKQ